MALSYTELQAVINETYLPNMYNNIFTDNHYLWALLKKKAKTYDTLQISQALEYAKATNIQFKARGATIPLGHEEIATKAIYLPKMLIGTLTIYKEDELENKSPESILNLTEQKVQNLQEAIEEYAANYIWIRGSSLPDANGWETIDRIVSATVTLGSIAVADAAWWVSNVLAAGTVFTGCDPTTKADLTDSSKECYLPKMLQRGIARSRRLKGGGAGLIVLPQAVWDLLEDILDPQKHGNKYSDKAGEMGFTALRYRGIDIYPDDDMAANQTGDTDGRIYFLNLKHLYLFFNSDAKFTMDNWKEAQGNIDRTAPVLAYGNFVCSNRKTQTVITGIWSPKTYVSG